MDLIRAPSESLRFHVAIFKVQVLLYCYYTLEGFNFFSPSLSHQVLIKIEVIYKCSLMIINEFIGLIRKQREYRFASLYAYESCNISRWKLYQLKFYLQPYFSLDNRKPRHVRTIYIKFKRINIRNAITLYTVRNAFLQTKVLQEMKKNKIPSSIFVLGKQPTAAAADVPRP